MSRILTQYHGPTDTRGARIAAEYRPLRVHDARRISVPYDHALRREERHKTAALALLSSMGIDDAKTVELTGEEGKRLVWAIVNKV